MHVLKHLLYHSYNQNRLVLSNVTHRLPDRSILKHFNVVWLLIPFLKGQLPTFWTGIFECFFVCFFVCVGIFISEHTTFSMRLNRITELCRNTKPAVLFIREDVQLCNKFCYSFHERVKTDQHSFNLICEMLPAGLRC